MDMPKHDWSGFRPDGQALPRDLKIAIDYMRKNIGQQIRIADLLMATRAPERTLRKHFLRFFGLAPLELPAATASCGREGCAARLVRRQRDARSRSGLALRISDGSRPTTGRCFGELPSATRRREVLLEQTRRSAAATSRRRRRTSR